MGAARADLGIRAAYAFGGLAHRGQPVVGRIDMGLFNGDLLLKWVGVVHEIQTLSRGDEASLRVGHAT